MKWHNQVGWVATQLAIREQRMQASSAKISLISKGLLMKTA
ncbi:hypothetical protein [Legionella feeleii]|uniref:Uncharacterized protein n=1 Tax=Legionella feeleii TaxID=453 RepID=A0A2X1QRF4_9GAMM|nr:hypothetical protein [Legionella feeleii]SPX60696.1 Uncharacterised protein [Legionella feeleii]